MIIPKEGYLCFPDGFQRGRWWEKSSKEFFQERRVNLVPLSLLVLFVNVIQSLDDTFENIIKSIDKSRGINVEGREGSIVVDWLILSSSLSEQESETKSGNHESAKSEKDNQWQHVGHDRRKHRSNGSQKTRSSSSQASLSSNGCGDGRFGCFLLRSR